MEWYLITQSISVRSSVMKKSDFQQLYTGYFVELAYKIVSKN